MKTADFYQGTADAMGLALYRNHPPSTAARW
jgi:hypothetical protein